MERYKDIILSQPPAMYGSTGKAADVAVESYKGILLCARPANLQYFPSSQLRGGVAAGESAVLKKDGSLAPAFIPAGAAETQVGLGPSAEERATMERNHRKRLENYKTNRANTCTVLTRHKRWLRSFAAEVRRMKQEEIEREQQCARQAEQLRRQHAQKRLDAEAEQSAKEAQQNQQQQAAVSPPSANAEAEASAPVPTKKKTKKKKPKWALTEDEALEEELAKADELLEFAKNLDYEKYISDYEIAGALAIMRERVEEIARENNWSKEAVEQAANEPLDDEGEDSDDEHGERKVASGGGNEPRRECAATLRNICTAAAKRAAPQKFANHQKEWDKSTSIGNVLKRAIFRDTLRLAERILASSASMQKIHTKYSLARILQRCVLNGDNVAEAMEKPSIGGSKGLDKIPRIVKVHPEATGLETVVNDGEETEGSRRVLLAMQRSKDRTQGLPYLYRCPAL